MKQSLRKRLSILLITPHSSVTDQADRRLVLLLSVYNLVTVPLGPLVSIIRPSMPTFLWVAVFIICLSFYLLSRSAYALIATKVQILTSVAIPIVFAALIPDRASVHFSFLLPVLLSMLLYSLQTLVICSTTSLVSFLVVTHFFQAANPTLRSGSFIMLTLLTSILIMTRYHLHWLEHERELRKEQNRRKYLALVHSTFDGIATVSQSTFTYVSEGFAAVFSESPTDIMNRSVTDFLESTLKTSEQLDDELRLFSAVNSNGEMRFIQIISEQVDAMETIIAVRDVTVEQDENLHRLLMERVTSTGMIASSVAHEMNTPLMIAQSQIERSIQAVEALPGPVFERLSSANSALNQIESILKDLRWFVDSGAIDYTPVPKSAIQNAIRLARHRIQHRTTLVVELDNLPALSIPEGKLSQVIINLVFNAAKAVASDQDAVKIWITGRTIGDDVELVIRDNGVGIPTHLHQRIFAPFFTTDESEGMGLGLALCQSIIHTAKGRMELSSEPGEGTTFKLRIPIHSGSFSETSVERDPLLPQHIVVIESHDQVLEMIGEFLSEQHVSLCKNVNEGIASIDHNTVLVICDARLPGGGADQLVRHLSSLAINCQPEVCFMTNVGQPTDEDFAANLRHYDLERPFTESQLKGIVYRVFNSKG